MTRYLPYLAVIILTSLNLSAEETRSWIGYQRIVNALEREALHSSRSKVGTSNDPFTYSRFHLGTGFTSAVHRTRSGSEASYAQGLQATLGIDLFTPHFRFEGSLRNLRQSPERIKIREFELKALYQQLVATNTELRIGTGIGAREVSHQESQTTPTWIVVSGLGFYLSQNISIGVDLSYRISMLSEARSRDGFDSTLRIDSHF